MSAPELTVANQAKRGVFSLLGRQAVLFPVSFVTGIILARLLSPAEFGTYATVTFLVMGAGVLLDVGLGSIIVQQPEEPTNPQLRSIFTVQALLFGAAALVIALMAPYLVLLFKLEDPSEGVWLFRTMALHMLLATLGTNSTLLLERRMAFSTFARLDVANVLLDRSLTLGMAFAGFGVWSFVLGSLIALAVRVALLNLAAPWPIGFALDRALLRRALGFGMTLQATNLTALARDNLNTLIGGSFFGPQKVGYLNWGLNLANTCSQPLVQIMARVCFPAFARLHDDHAERRRVLHAALRAVNFSSFPLLMVLIPQGTHIVTFFYGEAWRPALFALNCFAVRLMAANVTSTLIGYMNATGRAAEALRIAVAWTAAEAVLALTLLPSYGFNGVALAYAVGPFLPVTWLLLSLHREIQLPYFRVFGLPLVTGLAAAGVAWVAAGYVTTLGALFAALLLSGGVAIVCIALFEREALLVILQSVERRFQAAVNVEEPGEVVLRPPAAVRHTSPLDDGDARKSGPFE